MTSLCAVAGGARSAITCRSAAALRCSLAVLTALAAAFAAAFALAAASGCGGHREEQPPADEQQHHVGHSHVPATTASRPTTFDLWYQVHLDGQPVGYRHVEMTHDTRGPGAQRGAGARILVFRSEQRIPGLARGSVPAPTSRYSERCDTHGRLYQMTAEVTTATGVHTKRFQVHGDRVTVTLLPSGSTHEISVKAGAPLTGMCGMYLALLSGAKLWSMRTLDPRTESLVTGRLARRPGSSDAFIYTESSRPRVRTLLLVGPQRLPLRQTVHGMGALLELSISSRADALRLVSPQPSHPSPERGSRIPGGLAVNLGARIPEPLQARRIRIALMPSRALPQEVLAELGRGNQRTLPSSDPALVLVDVRGAGALSPQVAATPYPLPQRVLEELKPYTSGSRPALAARDPRRAQVAALLEGETSALRGALRLTSWASIARTHGFADRASLLVAALRSARIPARLVLGFLFVGSVMTEHRWVEAHLSRWVPLDPETGGSATSSHLRLAVSQAADLRQRPDAAWRRLQPSLRGLRARLVEAVLASGFRFVPGAQGNTQEVGNVLYHRVWNMVVRRPPSARFLVGGARDSFDLAVISIHANTLVRLQLQIYAASPEGLDDRTFLAMGYRPQKIGQTSYLVKTQGATHPSNDPTATPPQPRQAQLRQAQPRRAQPRQTQPRRAQPRRAQPRRAQPRRAGISQRTSMKRTYVQMSCSDSPWGARLVRWTLTARPLRAPETAAQVAGQIATLEKKTLGTFHMKGHPASARGCTKKSRSFRKQPRSPTRPKSEP